MMYCNFNTVSFHCTCATNI